MHIIIESFRSIPQNRMVNIFLTQEIPIAMSDITKIGTDTAKESLIPAADESSGQILRTIDTVRERINPNIELQGVVLTMHDRRNNLTNQVEDDVRAHLKDKVYRTVIPRNVRISEAPSFGKPALLYDLKCPGSQAYIQLASEVIQRERARPRAA